MRIKKDYQKRPIRFLELYQHNDWTIKIYSISVNSEYVQNGHVINAKLQLDTWLQNTKLYDLETYKTATLILHEGKEGCFAIINWWIDENMLQLYAYLASNEKPTEFKLFSNNGIITCVWEMAVLWYDRNAWVENILMKSNTPDIQAYLNAQLNTDI